ncbi:MAG TPA: GTPase Era [Nitrospirota bacterium]|nr:GTPase Era [Nitrospirota bacterium]
MFKSGFVSIIGRPNVGKSTLMNALLGEKISIVSNKPQTTRNKVTGILTLPEAQVVFLDTPGIHRPKGLLNEYMVKAAKNACEEVDLVLLMVEAGRRPAPGEEEILDFVKGLGTKVFLVINKIDLVEKAALLPLIERYSSMNIFAEVIPVSSLKDVNLGDLQTTIIGYLPEGPKYFPDEDLSDQPERFIVAEIVREKIFRYTGEEVPYSTAVLVEEMKDKGDIVYARADIYVEKESQKAIIIGAGGRMLKKIGQAAREDAEKLLGSKIFLELWVKVKKDWRDKPGALREMGYK